MRFLGFSSENAERSLPDAVCLTDEQQMIVDTVRSFVEHEIYPHEDAIERSGEVSKEVAHGEAK
ncbi:acyl-CoA dehydrogenase [Roseobacter sp. CCS2]|nr:acyl-CoA dehydrogenase [Roseobacter sp. CCS2]